MRQRNKKISTVVPLTICNDDSIGGSDLPNRTEIFLLENEVTFKYHTIIIYTQCEQFDPRQKSDPCRRLSADHFHIFSEELIISRSEQQHNNRDNVIVSMRPTALSLRRFHLSLQGVNFSPTNQNGRRIWKICYCALTH